MSILSMALCLVYSLITIGGYIRTLENELFLHCCFCYALSSKY
ncbi:hypothetical protein HMPREF9134_00443 [Porphyromonas catoniae F0037]|uniref:Uncharacterized protein n=1 Tax=Porphyromonas catoniae F0037 TaxID=1127696 RepID=L1NGB9_9PORP|nr:hypothetical protein HMPREF9134_00443 [Porphyromonas catoniae F0037]